ncbi:MAG: hypothetical protein JXR70_07745 [Spirochaetales bacterium]|nr:hypothetical protein [Spirochaetales bacterium]
MTVQKSRCIKPCPVCGHLIEKANYMGGSIYFCAACQRQ